MIYGAALALYILASTILTVVLPAIDWARKAKMTADQAIGLAGAFAGLLAAGIAFATYLLVRRQIDIANKQTAIAEDQKLIAIEQSKISVSQLRLAEREIALVEQQGKILEHQEHEMNRRAHLVTMG